MLACFYKHNIVALCQNLYIYPKNMLTFEMKLIKFVSNKAAALLSHLLVEFTSHFFPSALERTLRSRLM